MKKEINLILTDHRNRLLREAKQEKDENYKKGYVDGILDMFNKSTSTIDNHIEE